tara:strand:- start:423 stop:866 length:444 start_codon:yes stop_codon:yes gene_type:complete
MKYFLYYAPIIFTLVNLNAEEIYKFKTMGKEKNTSVILPDGSSFNTFFSEGAFTDSDGNYGDITGRGVRETDNNGNIKNLSALLVFETKNNGKYFAKANRIDSKIEAGAGYFDVLFGSGSFKKLKGKRCKYGLTITQKSFVMEGHCK